MLTKLAVHFTILFTTVIIQLTATTVLFAKHVLQQPNANADIKSSIWEWLLMQTPTVVVLGIVLWKTYLLFKEERDYNKKIVENNMTVLNTLSNTLTNLNTEIEKTAEKNQKLQELLLRLSSTLEKS